MPSIYSVRCTDAATGREFERRVTASDADEALTLASGHGVLTSSAIYVGPAAPEAPEPPSELAIIQSQLAQLAADVRALRNAPLVRAPRSTIGWGVVCGLVFWMLIVLAFWVVLFALGGLGAGLLRLAR